ncbi:hypothetical protein CCH79_00015602 [Gambusia affinis]|uniref:Transmembrane protein n=1 Tax=Gambusia affinis TaxID=33528 RepID=A0A315VG00_GAMAF|nr:hypothetical protein CCH79_00015602 [Gambusia affinis]
MVETRGGTKVKASSPKTGSSSSSPAVVLLAAVVFYRFPVSRSEAKIPLWRWQRMMIFMLANTVCCIVASVLLNIVDRSQVRHRRRLADAGGTLNKTTKRSRPAEGDAEREPLTRTLEEEEQNQTNSINS